MLRRPPKRSRTPAFHPADGSREAAPPGLQSRNIRQRGGRNAVADRPAGRHEDHDRGRAGGGLRRRRRPVRDVQPRRHEPAGQDRLHARAGARRDRRPADLGQQRLAQPRRLPAGRRRAPSAPPTRPPSAPPAPRSTTMPQAYRAFPISAEATAAITQFENDWSAYDAKLADEVLPWRSRRAAGSKVRRPGHRDGHGPRRPRARCPTVTVRAGADQETTAESRYQHTKWLVSLLLGAAPWCSAWRSPPASPG